MVGLASPPFVGRRSPGPLAGKPSSPGMRLIFEATTFLPALHPRIETESVLVLGRKIIGVSLATLAMTGPIAAM